MDPARTLALMLGERKGRKEKGTFTAPRKKQKRGHPSFHSRESAGVMATRIRFVVRGSAHSERASLLDRHCERPHRNTGGSRRSRAGSATPEKARRRRWRSTRSRPSRSSCRVNSCRSGRNLAWPGLSTRQIELDGLVGFRAAVRDAQRNFRVATGDNPATDQMNLALGGCGQVHAKGGGRRWVEKGFVRAGGEAVVTKRRSPRSRDRPPGPRTRTGTSGRQRTVAPGGSDGGGDPESSSS